MEKVADEERAKLIVSVGGGRSLGSLWAGR